LKELLEKRNLEFTAHSLRREQLRQAELRRPWASNASVLMTSASEKYCSRKASDGHPLPALSIAHTCECKRTKTSARSVTVIAEWESTPTRDLGAQELEGGRQTTGSTHECILLHSPKHQDAKVNDTPKHHPCSCAVHWPLLLGTPSCR
jgi:hypothetical protein